MNRSMMRWLFVLVLGLAPLAGEAQTLAERMAPLQGAHPGQSGVWVLERGEEALVTRAWLADQAARTLDIQYFIWTTDNVGILAAASFLHAAQRGVRVRVLVDDLLVDAPPEAMLALAAHPLIDIRVYNPRHTVGLSTLGRVRRLVTGFRASNQRMHDKTAIFDGLLGITGGRNMADEYFDLDTRFSFRDRDALVAGPAVSAMTESFERFWNSPLARPVEHLLPAGVRRLSEARIQEVYGELGRYAANPEHFSPEVRQAVDEAEPGFRRMLGGMRWSEVRFLCDAPGKNDGRSGLKGQGATTRALVEVLRTARSRVTIQSPYLVVSALGMELLRELKARGVEVRISTNSLASTDNLQAFSGYQKQRQRLLQTGARIFEFRPDAAVRHQLTRRPMQAFSLHAKSLVVDGETVFIGTFNLDPRSAHLNTEVGILTRDPELARSLEEAILRDMEPENSWDAREAPDRHAPAAKRHRARFWKLLPLTPIL